MLLLSSVFFNIRLLPFVASSVHVQLLGSSVAKISEGTMSSPSNQSWRNDAKQNDSQYHKTTVPVRLSNRFKYVNADDSDEESESFSLYKPAQKKQAKFYSAGFPTPILFKQLLAKLFYYKNTVKKTYNQAICGLGVEAFMSYAAYFCKYETLDSTLEVISVGSGDGTVEGSIMEAYRKHFGSELKITLVDKNPKFEVNYSTVTDLIEKRPNVVGNCVSLIIWPETPSENDNYDIDSIHQLQPRAALVLYETTAISGSDYFVELLNEGKPHWEYDKMLGNYEMEEVAYQEVHVDANSSTIISSPPGTPIYKIRMVKLKRND